MQSNATQGCEVWLWALEITISLKSSGPLSRKRADIEVGQKEGNSCVALDQGVPK